MSEIIYGIRASDGKIISVDEVPQNMSGLACGCICAYCKRQLQACSLNGRVRSYFRHHSENRSNNLAEQTIYCNANIANETALHKMAKQIIAQEKKIYLPCKNITVREAGIKDLPQKVENDIPCFELREAHMIEAQSVELEKRLDNFTPDIVFTMGQRELLIEVFVSHRVDEDKRQKAEKYGSAMLEIDLSSFSGNPISSEKLRDILLGEEKHRKWIYYPLSAKFIERARSYYESTDIVKRYREECEKKKREELDRKRRNYKIKNLFNEKVYVNELKRLRSDKKFLEFYKNNRKSYWFSIKNIEEIPFFVDIPITGEIIFKCDRRIWQSILFNRYIYGRKEDNASLNVESMFDVLIKDYQVQVDYDLSFKLDNPLYEEQTIFLRNDVIDKYMQYLETLGFIAPSNLIEYNWKTVKARRTIIPPNKEAANELQFALNKVDLYLPNIDRLIDEKMRNYFIEKHRKEMEIAKQTEKERIQRLEEERQQKLKEEAARKEKQRLECIKQEEKLKQEKYEMGFLQVKDIDFAKKENIYDRDGNRWVKCIHCNQIKQEHEMLVSQYGEGECRECLHFKNSPANK